MNRPGRRSCVFAAALAAAWTPTQSAPSPAVPLERAELPGFSLEAPAWREVETQGGAAVGSHRRELGPVVEAPVLAEPGKVKRIAAGTLVVHWRGGVSSAEEQQEMRRLLVQSVAGSLGLETQAKTLTAGRWVETGAGPNGAIAVGGAYCETGLMVNVVLGMREVQSAQLEQTASDVVRSIACKAGAALATPPSLSIALPASFGVAAGSSPEMYYSLDGSVLVANVTSGNIVRDTRDLDPVISSLLGGVQELESPRTSTQPFGRNDKRPAALTTIDAHIAHEPTQLFLGSLYCEEIGASYVLFMAGERMSRAAAEQLAGAMQCPGASTRKAPSVSEVFAPACKAGDANACSMLIGLIGEGAAKEDQASLAELKRAACKHGVAEHCEPARR